MLIFVIVILIKILYILEDIYIEKEVNNVKVNKYYEVYFK